MTQFPKSSQEQRERAQAWRRRRTQKRIAWAFAIAVSGTAALGVTAFLAEPKCVSSALAKGVGNTLTWTGEKFLGLNP